MIKKAKAQTNEQTYQPRDIVLAKIRGFPPWPGMIVDPEAVPDSVAKERPNGKAKKGNWYCVRFFPAGDYAWIVPKDISKLQHHEINAYIAEPFKRSGDLLKGYRIALDPKPWEDEKDAAMAEAQEEEANAEVDQLESDGEVEADDDESASEKKRKSKKRKRESDAAKAKKTSAEPTSKPRSTAGKGKKSGPKSKAVVESEDEGGAEDEHQSTSKRSSPPPAKKTKRDKEEDTDPALAKDEEAVRVKEWRHKLQKAFLNPKLVPKEDEMAGLDVLFSTVENYSNMTMEYLLSSKIGKVMRHIHILADDRVPLDDQYKFRERAKALVDKWHDILKTNGAPDSAKPAANGSRKATDAEDFGPISNGKSDTHSESKANGSKADVDVAMNSDNTGANGIADESVLADVTMSEAA